MCKTDSCFGLATGLAFLPPQLGLASPLEASEGPVEPGMSMKPLLCTRSRLRPFTVESPPVWALRAHSGARASSQVAWRGLVECDAQPLFVTLSPGPCCSLELLCHC